MILVPIFIILPYVRSIVVSLAFLPVPQFSSALKTHLSFQYGKLLMQKLITLPALERENNVFQLINAILDLLRKSVVSQKLAFEDSYLNIMGFNLQGHAVSCSCFFILSGLAASISFSSCSHGNYVLCCQTFRFCCARCPLQTSLL